MFTVRDIFSLKPKDGDIGFELEVEGRNLPRFEVDPYFTRVRDGSLKGEDTGEYIFSNPLPFEEVKKALDHLKGLLSKPIVKVNDSVRAGIHVHVNVQDLNMIQVYNFLVLYLILEEILVSTEVCGEGRDGNLFCLKASDADFLIHFMSHISKRQRWNELYTDEIRYASVNLKAVAEKGSLEFRSMRTTMDFDLVYKWICTLYKLKQSALLFKTPDEILENFSEHSGQDFMIKILGDLAVDYLKLPRLGQRIMAGMRNAQDIAYSTDWSAYLKKLEAASELKNPFRRSRILKEENVAALPIEGRVIGQEERRVRQLLQDVLEDRNLALANFVAGFENVLEPARMEDQVHIVRNPNNNN